MFSGTISKKRSIRFLGMHQKVVKYAYRIFVFYKPNLQYFPTTKDILEYEGHLGPDHIWLSKAIDNDHHFHPETGTGDALELINYHFKKLSAELAQKEPDRHLTSYHSAYLAHFVADMFTPPHIEEKNNVTEPEYYAKLRIFAKFVRFMLRTRKGKKEFKHQAFETNLWRATFGRKIKIELPEGEPLKIAEEIAADPAEYLTPMIRKTYQLKLFTNYKRNGWSKQISRKLRYVVLPRAVTTVAMFWLAACIEAQKMKNSGKRRTFKV